MSIEIPAEYQQFVESAIQSGGFKNEAEVVGEALRLLRERQGRLERLREQVRPALAQLDRSEGVELDDESLDEFFDEIRKRGKKRREAAERGDR